MPSHGSLADRAVLGVIDRAGDAPSQIQLANRTCVRLLGHTGSLWHAHQHMIAVSTAGRRAADVTHGLTAG